MIIQTSVGRMHKDCDIVRITFTDDSGSMVYNKPEEGDICGTIIIPMGWVSSNIDTSPYIIDIMVGVAGVDLMNLMIDHDVLPHGFDDVPRIVNMIVDVQKAEIERINKTNQVA